MNDTPESLVFTRRDALRNGALAALTFVLLKLGAITPAEAAEAQLVFGTVGGAWHDGIKKIFLEQTGFEKQHDTKVVWDVQADTSLITKALSSCARPVYDLLQAGVTGAAKLAVSNCIAPYDRAIITNLANVDETYKSGDYFVAVIRLLNGLVYNTKHVTEKPTSWDDLANPKFKGKVGVPAYSWVGSQFLHAINKAHGGDEANIEPGIKASAAIVRGNDAVMIQHSNMGDQAFQREEIWIMPFWTGRMINLKASGVPVDIYYQKDFLFADVGYVVPKNGRNVQLAQKLINTALDPEAQLSILKLFKYQPTNNKVVVPNDLKDAVLPPYARDRAAKIDWKKVNEYADRDLERWNKDVLGS
jgi:putative spermidine/putrescine transport system substrate-binding protein